MTDNHRTLTNAHNIYLDYAATSPLLPSVKAKMIEVLDLDLGNASALHSIGHRTQQIIEDARAMIACLINAQPQEIIFTSGGTESNNTIAHIFAGQTIATSSIEHPSMLTAAKYYAKEHLLLPVNHYGSVDPNTIPASTNLVSVMLANNELGTIEPIEQISAQIKQYDSERSDTGNRIYLHSDATQALGKIKVDVQQLGVDYLTLSAHKIGGPVGIGALYVRQGAPFQPLLLGGHQEQKRRAGTQNTLAIAGFGAAANWCWENWSCQKYLNVAKLRNYLAERILAEVPYSSLNSHLEDCLPHILNVSFQAAEGESIQLYLDAAGISVSTGSACAAGDTQPSHVLMAATGDAEVAHSSIRFSLGLDTSQDNIDYVMTVLPKIVRRLQGISTIKIKNH